MHIYKPPPVGGLDRVPVFTAGTGTTRADLFELDGVTPMPGNVLVADTGGNLPSFQCATSPVYVGVSGSRTTWTPSESGQPTAASGASLIASAAASSGHIKGEDIYPAMTLVASSGSDITLDVDGQTIHCAAGIYDVCVGFRLGSDAPATLGVYVDGLPLHQDLLCEEITYAGNVSGAGGWATALGVVLAAPAALLLNFEMDSASSVNWSITAAQITVRRVGDAPNP